MTLQQKLEAALEKRKALVTSITNAETKEALDKIELDLRKADIEIAGLKEAIEEEQRSAQGNPEERAAGSNLPQGQFNPISTYGLTTQRRSSEAEQEAEYRKAFMEYTLRGTAIPTELRAATGTADIGVVIPNTVMNKIIEQLKTYGEIFRRVTLTNIKGGVTIPIASAKPVATWTAEGTVADKQKKEVKGTVTFSYNKLQCRVAVTLEADTTSLAIFESTLTDNVYEAMIIAIEEAIVNGTGTLQPLGFTKDTRVLASQKVELSATDIKSWEEWSKVFAKVPKSKRAGAVVLLNTETWEGDILGMTDSTGQPIARVTVGLNGEDKPMFKGKEVIDVESYLPSYEAAEVGDVFGAILNLKDYMLNSNLAMTVKRYFDEDTDEWITKSTLIADGKLADAQGVILLVKKA